MAAVSGYMMVAVSVKGTIGDTCTSEGIVAGTGFYEVSKSEKVSAKKKVLLYHAASDAVFEDGAARTKCGLPLSGDVTVNKSTAPAGHRLFVQSTSHNRVVDAGSHILVPASPAPTSSASVTVIGRGACSSGGACGGAGGPGKTAPVASSKTSKKRGGSSEQNTGNKPVKRAAAAASGEVSAEKAVELLDRWAARGDVGTHSQVAKAADVEKAVQLLTDHIASENVQSKGCSVLYYYAQKSSRNAALIVASGGVDRVMAAMDAHAASKHVLESAAHAVMGLASDGGAEIAAAFVKAGAIQALVRALDALPDERWVIGAACNALVALCQAPTAQAVMLECGVVDRLCRHVDECCNPDWKHLWCQLSLRTPQEKAAYETCRRLGSADHAVTAKVARELFAVMDAHLPSSIIQEAGCDAVFHLTCTADPEPARALMPAEGCLSRLLAAMNSCVTYDGLQRAGCRAIRWLVDDKNKAGMIASGAIPALLRALDTIRTSPSLHLDACYALNDLCSVAAGESSFLEEGGAAIFAAVAVYSHQPHLERALERSSKGTH